MIKRKIAMLIIKTLFILNLPLKVTFGKNMVPRIRPEKNPNIFAKLSIIGSKPIKNKITIHIVSFNKGSNGF